MLASHVGFVGVCLAAPLAWVAALVPVWVSYHRRRRWLAEEETLLAQERESAQALLDDAGSGHRP